MKRKMIGVSFGVIALGCIAIFIIGMTPADAKNYGFKNHHLWGDYASQLTGTINYPEESPFSLFNGPYCLTGLVSVDGNGNARGIEYYDSYNGMLFNYSWEGTYEVNPDGTLMIDAYYELNGTGIYVQFFGVLCDNGRQVRLMHVGPIPENASPPNMLSSTVVGSWIRQ